MPVMIKSDIKLSQETLIELLMLLQNKASKVSSDPRVAVGEIKTSRLYIYIFGVEWDTMSAEKNVISNAHTLLSDKVAMTAIYLLRQNQTHPHPLMTILQEPELAEEKNSTESQTASNPIPSRRLSCIYEKIPHITDILCEARKVSTEQINQYFKLANIKVSQKHLHHYAATKCILKFESNHQIQYAVGGATEHNDSIATSAIMSALGCAIAEMKGDDLNIREVHLFCPEKKSSADLLTKTELQVFTEFGADDMVIHTHHEPQEKPLNEVEVLAREFEQAEMRPAIKMSS